MKKLFTLLTVLIIVVCNAQEQGNFSIPSAYIGTWTSTSGNDTIVITDRSITWTSNTNDLFVSYVDYIYHSDSIVFTFYAYPNVFKLTFEKISRIKMIFDAQTDQGYSLRNDIYFKQTRL